MAEMVASAINAGILIVTILLIGGTSASGVYLYTWYKKYLEYTCIIWERDGSGNLSESVDKAGVFVDKKTNNKRLFLLRNKVGLDPDTIPFIIGKKGKRTVYLYKTGLKNFHYIKIKLDHPKLTLQVGEEDLNWAVNDYERVKNRFNQSKFMQLLPFIAIAFTVIVILIIFIYFFKQFPVLKEVAVAFKEASMHLAEASSGTKVI